MSEEQGKCSTCKHLVKRGGYYYCTHESHEQDYCVYDPTWVTCPDWHDTLPTAKVKLNVYCEKDKIYVEGTSKDVTLKDMKLDVTDLAIVAIIDSMEYLARKTGYCAYISGGRKIEFTNDKEVSE